jgi:hypothetical protein
VNIGFVYGDSGTPNKVGESSQKLHSMLGAGNDPVMFIAFPGSGSGKHLGRNAQAIIPVRVLMHTLRLGANAAELATHLAMGQNLAVPKGAAGMSLAC